MRIRALERCGYTLLEVMLAMLIAVILMAGFYVAIDTTLREMDEGRTRVEQSTVSRALFQRISYDLTPSIGPVAPQTSSSSSGSGSGAGTSGGSSTGTGGGAAAADTTSTDAAPPVAFGIGVKGESDHVSIFLTRLNRALIQPPEDASGTTPANSDVTRITYFMDGSRGLCREEILQATSEMVDTSPTGFLENDTRYKVVAGEVKSFDIRYYDGSSWQTSWDGSTPGPDGKTPQGPPRAMEITISLRDGAGVQQTFKHTICFPTSPGPSSRTSDTSSTTGK